MSERERFEAWASSEGYSLRSGDDGEGWCYTSPATCSVWDAWQAAELLARDDAARARSGQAASGSSQGARSDDQTEVEQFNAWFAALTFEKLGSDSMEWAAWKARATLVGQPEAPTAAPLAYAVFADNGNLRLWSHTTHEASKLAKALGRPLIPLYAHPPARSGAGSEGGQG